MRSRPPTIDVLTATDRRYRAADQTEHYGCYNGEINKSCVTFWGAWNSSTMRLRGIDLLTIYLESDYTITRALNGQQALELAQSHPQTNLILLDIAMPGMDGYETCSELKANKATADIPVVFLTASEHEQDETTGFEVGAVEMTSDEFKSKMLSMRVG